MRPTTTSAWSSSSAHSTAAVKSQVSQSHSGCKVFSGSIKHFYGAVKAFYSAAELFYGAVNKFYGAVDIIDGAVEGSYSRPTFNCFLFPALRLVKIVDELGRVRLPLPRETTGVAPAMNP